MKKLLIAWVLALGTAAVAGSSAAGAAANPAKASVSIIHVQKGCHVFSGAVRGAHIRLSLAQGGALTVLNQDIDGHQLVQTSGPAKLALKALKMNDRAVLRFTKPGSYTFGTKPFELKGMPAVKTMGMDNALRITVTVR